MFAGSGSIAFEAISRGIEYAQLYEIDSNNIRIIKKNAENLKLNNLEVIPKRLRKWVKNL